MDQTSSSEEENSEDEHENNESTTKREQRHRFVLAPKSDKASVPPENAPGSSEQHSSSHSANEKTPKKKNKGASFGKEANSDVSTSRQTVNRSLRPTRRSILEELPPIPDELKAAYRTPSKSVNKRAISPETTAPQRKKTKTALAQRPVEHAPQPTVTPGQSSSGPDSYRGGRFIRPDPMPDNTPDNEKLAAWRNFKRRFNNAIAITGNMSEHAKANYLCIAVGNKVNDIIATQNMFPEKDSVGDDFPFFTHMIGMLDDYFEETFDQQINVNMLHTMEQKEDESAREFYQRILVQASITLKDANSEDAVETVRQILLRGLKDQVWAKLAFNLNLDAKNIVLTASRSSLFPVTQSAHNTSQQPIEVNAVSATAAGGPTDQQGKRKWKNTTQGSYAKNRDRTDNRQRETFSSPCTSCGMTSHNVRGVCPAMGRTCNVCRGRNHYAAVCPEKGKGSVNRISNEKQSSEVKIIDGSEDNA